MPCYEGVVTADAGRLDVYVSSALGLLTRSQIKSRNLTARVNDKAVKLSRPVKAGDRIALAWDERLPLELIPENIPLTVVYEDADCIVVDKAQGMVVHPGAGNQCGTLVNALLWRRTLEPAVTKDYPRRAAQPATRTGECVAPPRCAPQDAATKIQPNGQLVASPLGIQAGGVAGVSPAEGVAEDPNGGRYGRAKGAGHVDRSEGLERGGDFPPSMCTENREMRPFIVHRLDKDTSGVMIAAYTEGALEFLSRQFRERSVRKTYIAIVAGVPPESRGLIDTRLCRDSRNRKKFMVSEKTGKRAVTRYKRLTSWAEGAAAYSLLVLKPRTGRTHQLRVHLCHIGCPILGDPLYSKKDPRHPDATLMLHALSLAITLPNGERGVFKAALPGRFTALIPGERGIDSFRCLR